MHRSRNILIDARYFSKLLYSFAEWTALKNQKIKQRKITGVFF